MTIDIIFAAAQIPLAFALAWQCANKRKAVTGGLRDALLLIISCAACMIAWRLATLSQIVDPTYRPAGGMGIQTLFIVAFYVLVSAIGKHSGQHN